MRYSEILRANPLEDMEYEKKPAPKHRHISRAELKAILETPMLDPLQKLGRRAFLFSTFTGLAYVDIMLLHPHHIGRTAGVTSASTEKRPTWRHSSPCTR